MQKGFSLIEVAIVIVVIGLLVGGIIAGRDLIRAANIRGVHNDVTKITTAVNQFRTKFSALPGDFKRASSYWPTATNGDGDHLIEHSAGVAPAEEYYLWQHLANAEFIGGYYDGTSTTNIPESSVDGGYYRLNYQSTIYGKVSHFLFLSSINPSNSIAESVVLSPNETYEMDVKYDDGLVDTGKILGANETGVGGCATNDIDQPTSDYITGSDVIACVVYFRADY